MATTEEAGNASPSDWDAFGKFTQRYTRYTARVAGGSKLKIQSYPTEPVECAKVVQVVEAPEVIEVPKLAKVRAPLLKAILVSSPCLERRRLQN